MKLETMQGIVAARAHGICEGCGQYGLVCHTHHRRARGMGGTHREQEERKNDPRNALRLCAITCHPATEHEDTWQECAGKGWRISLNGQRDPFLTPVLIYTVNGYGWWLLGENGDYRWIDWPLEKRITLEDDSNGND